MSLPDDIALGAYKQILDVGVVGAVCLLQIMLLIVIWRYFNRKLEEADDRLEKEELAHEVTRTARIEELSANKALAIAVQEQMRVQAEAFRAVLTVLGDRNDRRNAS